MTHASTIIMAIESVPACCNGAVGLPFNPVVYDTKAPLPSQCGQSDSFEDDQQLMEALKMAHQQLPPPGCNPPRNRSCQEVLRCFPSAPSGYYQIHVPNGSLVQVYCDMEGTNCGGQGGWMRVAHLNMTDPSASVLLALEFRLLTTQGSASELMLQGVNQLQLTHLD